MDASPELVTRLDRLLSYLGHDAGNLALRRDAVRAAFDSGQWETARELIDAGLWLHSDDPELYALSGFAYLQAQSFEAAQSALSVAIAGGVNAAEVRYNFAFACFMQRQYSQAFELLSDPAVAAVAPLALLLRARCLHHAQRPDEAVVDCRAYLALVPDDPEAHGLMGLVLQEQKRHDEAKAHVDTALEYKPQQLDAMLALASLYLDAGDYDTAALAFENLVVAHPECGRGWLGLAMIKLTHLELDAARSNITRAARHIPEHIGTWHVLAWIELMRGDVKAAEAAFVQAMALDRNFAETHGGLAIVAILQGREEAGRLSLRRALRLDPQAMSAQYGEMLLLQRAGRHEEARRILDAFLARPVAGGAGHFRDLVAKHQDYLRTHAGSTQPRVLH